MLLNESVPTDYQSVGGVIGLQEESTFVLSSTFEHERKRQLRALNPCDDDLIVDIETNGFRHRGQKVLCIEIVHLQSGTQFHAADQPGYLPINEALQLLQGADHLIGHNISAFDLPTLTRVYGIDFPAHKVVDTLIASRVLRADLTEMDAVEGVLPDFMIGKHSLEAWGHRLRMPGLKDDFQHHQDQPWSTALQDHCANDVLLEWALYLELLEADSQEPFFQQPGTSLNVT